MAGFAWSPCSLGVAAGEEKVPLMMRSSRLFLRPGTEGAQGRGATGWPNCSQQRSIGR